ncbi:EAL domain-containing protein [Salinarimonas sp.]|uniref:EAL domain-containing protein n=1 Tax=Salinarimonas sp. TaxID=2766526 RepID=UPI0032D921B9
MTSSSGTESARLAALRALAIVGTAPEPHFDALCRSAARLFRTPIALVSLMEADRQWFKARCGLDVDGTARDVAFCRFTILGDEPFVIEDAWADARFRDNPLVTGAPHIRFYAGVPLVLEPDVRVGSLCVIDTVPRPFDETDRAALRDLGAAVVAQLRLHQAHLRQSQDAALHAAQQAALAESEARYRTLAEALPHKVWVSRSDGTALYVNERMRAYHGEEAATLDARLALHHPRDLARLTHARREGIAAGKAFEATARLRRHDGAYRWHTLTMSPIRYGAGGAVAEWLGTSLDIDDLVRDKERLVEATQLLHLAQEAAEAGSFEWRVADKEARLSRDSRRLLGLPQDGPDPVSEDVFSRRVDPRDIDAIWSAGRRSVETGAPYRVEFRIPLDDGSTRWIMAVGRPVRDAESGAPRILGLNIDITERKLAEEALERSQALLRESEERLAFALEATNDGLWDWSVETGTVWFSERWATMLGYEADEIAPHVSSWERLVHPDDMPAVEAALTANFEGRVPIYECEHRVRHKDGTWRWILDRGKVVARADDGRPLRMVGTHTDITARKEAERRAERMARHDSLTDLANRACFRERLDDALARARDTGESVALLCLDLDRFKTVNDTLGHPVGDALLRAVAGRLAGQIRGGDLIARLGGDEFAVLQIGAAQPEAARSLAQRLVDALSTPVSVAGRDLSVGLSVGVALSPQDGVDADALFKNADLALYRAKGEGRSTFRFFEAQMDAAERSRQELEIDLRQAIAREELDLHFQPSLDVTTGAITGFEALARWTHPEHGPIPPDRFIPLAEDTKLISPLGDWVLRRACAVAATWPAPTRVAVNVSAVQFDRDDLPAIVADALARSGLSADRLELEITETVLMRESEAVVETLHRLRQLGVRIALDDFGTGYSSLSYLRRFGFDRIKIDRSFIREMDHPDTAAIVRAMVGLGARLGIAITAEGIETKAQLACVKAEGCSEAQGWLIGRPAPAEAARALLEARRRAA